jgi:DNA-binding transcriptional MocR family regulator
MLEGFERELPPGVSWTRPLGGFFTWLTLPDGVEALDVATRAADAGVAVVPGNAFFPDERGRRHVRVCFSRAGLEEIDEGVQLLGGVLRTM